MASSFAQARIRVVLVDSHALVRAGLRMLIESQPGIEVVGEAGNCPDAVTVVAREMPDIILLEPNTEEKDGVEIISGLLRADRSARILLVTGIRDARVHQRALELGALGILLKDQPAERLLKAIRKVQEGEAWVERSMMARMLTGMSGMRTNENEDPISANIATLSPREREIIAFIGSGLKNRQIADRLCISEITVRHHLSSIFSKLGVSDRLELVIFAFRYGIAKLPE
jgi:DNA-binding NarL/FixJ family response regulator